MYKETYSIWLQNSIHNEKVYEIIKRYAKEEDKDSFSPHVTLVSHIDSEETALKILNKLLVKKSTVIFDRVSTGDTYFQKLYLESSDNTYFFNSVSKIEGWPSLWAVSYTHLTLPTNDQV